MKSKMLTRIIGAFAAFSMAAGVGVAIGGAVAAKEAVQVKAATQWTAATISPGTDAVAIAVNSSSNNGIRVGTNKREGSGTISIPANATSLSLYAAGWKNKAVTMTLSISSGTISPSSWALTANDNATGTINSNAQITISSENDYINTFTLSSSTSSRTVTITSTTSEKRFLAWGAQTGVEASATYTVSFNANGGTGSMPAVANVSGSYTLPANGFTAPSGKVFSGWKAGNTGNLITAGGSYVVSSNVTFYAQWVNAYTVTYTAGSNGSGSYAHALQPAGTYTLLPFASLNGVSALSGYQFASYTVGGVNKNPGDTITLNAATTVTVNFEEKSLETTYDFTKNFNTYANSGWSTAYGSHTGLSGVDDIGGDYAATIDLYKASKQTQTITNQPVFATKTASGSWYKVCVFTLSEVGYKIKSVSVTFAQWGSKTPDVALFKGNGVTGTSLDSGTIGTKNTIIASDLNDTVFSIGYCDKNSSSNVQAGLTSITITLEAQASYGATDHIKVTGMPRTIYHVGEVYDSTGLTVTAYDNADESTANFKDVTANISTRFTSGVYTFDDADVPSTDMWIEYQEDGSTYTVDITINVYAIAEYELVADEPTDWSGNYLIVGVDGESNLLAMNGALMDPDIEQNFQVVTEKSAGIIEVGQEYEWTFASITGGYSIQGKSEKYIGRTVRSKGMNVSDTALANIVSFSDGDVTIAGAVSGEAGYQLSYNATGNRFRYYSSGSVKLYKLVESSAAVAYAETFLNDLGSVCNANGNSDLADLQLAWASLALDFNTSLSGNDKLLFKQGAADQSGDAIGRALALYDYIAGKYQEDLESEDCDNYDFMGREPQPLAQGKIVNIIESSEDKTMIGVIGALTIATIAAFSVITLKKRKSI